MKLQRNFTKALQDTQKFFAAEHVRLLPCIGTLQRYTLTKFLHDARAAANVMMLALPQAIAHATIAGLPIVYGILCSVVAAIVAPLFAGSRYTILGTTNATAFMLFSFFAVNPALSGRASELVMLLTLLVGLIAVAGAMLRVADLLQYVSRSVLVGYISGAAVLIMTNQLIPMLGLDKFVDIHAATSFAGLLIALIKAMPHTDWVAVVMGVTTLAGYAAIREWRPQWPAFALSLLLSSVLFGPLIRFGIQPFAHAETFVTFGFADLAPKLPRLFHQGVFNDISTLFGVALAIAFLASLENTLMSKTLASRTEERSDVNQDMLSVGMANLASALGGGMPASSSLNRSMLNHESGALTRFASMFCGIYTLIFALLIAASVGWGVPLIDYLPRAALAALIIAQSCSLFNARHLKICLRSTGDDASVLVITFLATLLAPLYVAIFVGVAISITLFLRKASRPYLIEYEFNEVGELREMGEKRQRPIPSISIVHVEGDLFFGAAELFRTQIQRTINDPRLKVIILRLKNARHLDATSVMALEDLILFMRAKNLHLLVSGATHEVYRVLKKSGILDTLQAGCDRDAGQSNLFLNSPSNPNLSTRDALKRAQQLLGTDQADIRIFYDPTQH
ncbi:MAG: SulP family inorganic anion transporter [Verrucomicrobia bacterium]|nr:MAG: SulP family inorganic anion transporter [Verrucomicrobiota bacterium]